jgi:hypothetical protein
MQVKMKPGKPLTFAKVPIPEQNRRAVSAPLLPVIASEIQRKPQPPGASHCSCTAVPEQLSLCLLLPAWLLCRLQHVPLLLLLPLLLPAAAAAGACWCLGCPATL